MSYRISSKARLDIIGIWEFTKDHWSVQQADRYYQLIVGKFSDISLKPDLGKSYDDLRIGYRGLIVKSHIIFYKSSKQGTIEIVRILHQRLDYKSKIVE